MAKLKSQVVSGAGNAPITLELALKVPIKERAPQGLNSAYCLIPKQMLPLLSRFLSRHNLGLRLAPLPAENVVGKYLILLSSGKQDRELIPGFVLSYIKDLPFCHVFKGFANPEESAIFLCEYGFNHPLEIAELVTKTTETGLYISFAGSCFENSIIRPVPELRPVSSTIQYEVALPLREFNFIPEIQTKTFSLPLRFVDFKAGLNESAQVLFLENREILWFKEMLYRLPGPLFAEIEWIGSRDSLFLFFNDSDRISFFPFGQPFRKITPNIFIPIDKDIVPHLEPEHLADLFQVESEYYAFVTDTWRRDLSVSVKAPLHKLLTISGDIKIEFKSDSDLNGFAWEDPGVITVKNVLTPAVEPSSSHGDIPAIPVAGQIAKNVIRTEEIRDESAVIKKSLKGYGVLLRRQGDLLGAATCFALAEENMAAADCYAEAARLITE